MQNAAENMRPLIYQMQDPAVEGFEKNPLTLAYGPPAFQEWVLAQERLGRKLW